MLTKKKKKKAPFLHHDKACPLPCHLQGQSPQLSAIWLSGCTVFPKPLPCHLINDTNNYYWINIFTNIVIKNDHVSVNKFPRVKKCLDQRTWPKLHLLPISISQKEEVWHFPGSCQRGWVGWGGKSRRCKIATGQFNAQSWLPANAISPTYLSIRYIFFSYSSHQYFPIC